MLRRRHLLQALPFLGIATGLPARAQGIRATLNVTAPDFPVPPLACDTHVHVFEDPKRFPLAPDRTYTPGLAPVEDLITHLAKLHCERVVLVQPGPVGFDNSAILNAVKILNGRARAVGVVGDDVSQAQLDRYDEQGMRGLRINLATPGIKDPATAKARVLRTAELIGKRPWHIQIYTELSVLSALKDTIAALPVPLVVDHMGRLEAEKGLDQPGFTDLIAMVKSGKVYVKLSAPHRLSKLPDYSDVQPYARALIAANPDRMLWGSDWPHPNSPNGQLDKIFPFRDEDDGKTLNLFARWAETPAMIKRILVDNPARLYGWA